MAGKLNLNALIKEHTGSSEIVRGDSIGPIKLTYTGPSLVGASAILTMRTGSNKGQISQILKSEDGDIVLDDDADHPIVVNVFQFVDAGVNYWDLQLVLGDGYTVTLFLDSAKITQDVSV